MFEPGREVIHMIALKFTNETKLAVPHSALRLAPEDTIFMI